MRYSSGWNCAQSLAIAVPMILYPQYVSACAEAPWGANSYKAPCRTLQMIENARDEWQLLSPY